LRSDGLRLAARTSAGLPATEKVCILF
jgi:hypothetical protein